MSGRIAGPNVAQSATGAQLALGPPGPAGPTGSPGAPGSIRLELNGGAPYPTEPVLNLLPNWASAVSVTDVPGVSTNLQLGGPIVQPTVQGGSTFTPTAAQQSAIGTSGISMQAAWWGKQTANATPVALVGTFPLPGQAGAPFASGTLHVDVLIVANSTTNSGGILPGATWKSSWSWTVTSGGAVTAMGSVSQPVAIGTNSGSPPASWAASLQLNGGSTAVEVLATGDASLAVNFNCYAQAFYAQ